MNLSILLNRQYLLLPGKERSKNVVLSFYVPDFKFLLGKASSVLPILLSSCAEVAWLEHFLEIGHVHFNQKVMSNQVEFELINPSFY